MTHPEAQSPVTQVSNNADTSLPTIHNRMSTVQTSTAQSENINSSSGGDSTTSSSLPSNVSQHDTPLVETNNPELGNKISLTLLLVSGKRHTFIFDPSYTVAMVKKQVFNDWPEEWAEETVPSVSGLKIVYLGRVLDDGTTLEANKIQRGQSIIMHLAIKNSIPSDNDDPKSTENAPKCHCTIL
ncbi:ubiquitin-like protein 3 [Gigaspora margarita]|uniref:Ubiquitin-like protein 3 n=2 Tax=Gigaspora margarita TaxID=4874 RepID=A0A8H3X398_GIGMA|nr:ubiquitin-like protein 3 [Gigaspora margarita]